jgi:phosphomannomutase
MRGTGVGTNRINKYTLVKKNTQGLSDYMINRFPEQFLKVAIAYDCRHNSNTLAKVVADVFSPMAFTCIFGYANYTRIIFAVVTF